MKFKNMNKEEFNEVLAELKKFLKELGIKGLKVEFNTAYKTIRINGKVFSSQDRMYDYLKVELNRTK